MTSPYREAAFRYLTHGWKGPLPVGTHPHQKTAPPAGYTGNDGAWPTEDQIAAWVDQKSDLNIALRLPENVVGLDVDDYDDKPGAQTMLAVIERHGRLSRTWISTAREGRSGIRWFRIDQPQILPGKLVHPDDPDVSGVEVIQRTHRYAVVPPSIHPSGDPYRWITAQGDNVSNGTVPRPDDLPVLPEAWIDHIRRQCSCWAPYDWNRHTPQSADPVTDTYQKWRAKMTAAYGRHDAALGGVMALTAFRLRGWPGANQALTRLHDEFVASLGDTRSSKEAEAEWQRMTEGAEKKAHTSTIPQWEDRKSTSTSAPSQSRRVRLTKAAGIKPRPVWWHWQDRIPIGEITLTPGLGGVGKSTFHTWVVAQTTRGTLSGVNLGRPRPAIICAAEDSWSRSIVPRLIAADADLELVYRADVVSDDGIELRLTLPADVDALAGEVDALGAALISLDPLLSTIDGSIDSHKSHEVRAALEPLRAIADQTDCVLLGNAHFNKATGTDPLQRITGSAAFGEVCRAAIAFAKDTDNGVYVLSQAKNNLGRLDLPSLTYAIVPEVVPTDEGPSEVGRFQFTGESTRDVRDILSWHIDHDKTERDFARETILLLLGDGPLPWEDLTAGLKREGVSEHTGRRARSDLKSEGLIDFTGGGRNAYQWCLTDKATQVAHHGQPIGQPIQLAHLAGESGQPGQPGQPKPLLEGTQPNRLPTGVGKPKPNEGTGNSRFAHTEQTPPARWASYSENRLPTPDDLPDPW
jgi:hypothetical protein